MLYILRSLMAENMARDAVERAERQQRSARREAEVCEMKYRLEQAVKDQNDKISAILDFLGLEITTEKPKSKRYIVASKT